MRKSKYIGMQSGEWTCTDILVSRVQAVYTKWFDDKGRKVRSRYPGHRGYAYVFQRPTSDGKAMKLIQLNASQIKQVSRGLLTVEQLANRKKQIENPAYRDKVCYNFID